MKDFFERWYGDCCPPWTWPLTAGGVAWTIVVLISNIAPRL